MAVRTVEDLIEQTHDPDPRVRKEAARELCPCELKADYDDVWSRVFELTRDESADVRRIVFHTLIDGSPKTREHDVVAAIESMHNDPDEKLRRTVRKRLANYRRTGQINQNH